MILHAAPSHDLGPPARYNCFVPEYSFSFLLMLLVASPLVLAALVYVGLHRRWSNPTGDVLVDHWRRENGLRRRLLRRGRLSRLFPRPMLPPPLDRFLAGTTTVRQTLHNAQFTIVQADDANLGRLHLLVRLTGARWSPRALRPSHATNSLIDRAGLHFYPDAAPHERFYVFAQHVRAAHALAQSAARGLLPADIGLLLTGPWLVIDFSTRPFDTTELSRLRTLADQLARMLPAS